MRCNVLRKDETTVVIFLYFMLHNFDVWIDAVKETENARNTAEVPEKVPALLKGHLLTLHYSFGAFAGKSTIILYIQDTQNQKEGKSCIW